MSQRGRSNYLMITSLGALGVVFGDIGTSPLYAFRESFHAADGLPVIDSNVLGILSLIFWSLMIVVTIKYLLFVMRADNHGEGGILALTALAIEPSSGTMRAGRRALLLIGLFGTALLYGDGVITPAISVLSAVEGLEIIAPALDSYIPSIASLIIIGLFLIQRQGTARVGAFFGPVMIVWFTTLGSLGAIEIARYPRVLGAISPTHATSFVANHPRLAFLALGAIFLVVTGSEALYADMGHFGRKPIRLVWGTFVLPCLLLNYFGQGARLIADPSAIGNPFYALAPVWGRIPLLILATMAAVIASQALISGAFSLTQQAIQLGYLPRMTVDHTSPREIGQVYVGAVNYMLMITCVAVVFGFGSSTALAGAYGVAVTATMLITSVILYFVMRRIWGWSALTAGGLTFTFLAVDVVFFAANLIKIPDGGWFPLMIGFLLLVVMLAWKSGRAEVSERLRSGHLPTERFIQSIATHPQVRIPGTAVYLTRDLGTVPPHMLANLRHNEVLHETVLLVTVRWAPSPRVPRARRATVHDLGEGFYQVLINYGFIENPDIPGALSDFTTADFGFDPDDAVYVIGRETVLTRDGLRIRDLRNRLFALMHRNSTSPIRFFDLPTERVIEVGTRVKIG